MAALIGTAGWSLPRAEQEYFPGGGSHLERYAARFRVAEINSSFHGSHREATWRRWRDSVPQTFRFSVKLPKAITHEQGLREADALLASFLDEVSVLESRLGAFLVQLPPKLVFDRAVAATFFSELRARTVLPIVCEPRHESWFSQSVDQLLQANQVSRVAADPARVPEAGVPGGWRGLSYYRLHGSPNIYYSSYSAEFIANMADRVQAKAGNGRETWVIFDNTTLGAATRNALELAHELDRGKVAIPASSHRSHRSP